MENAADTAIAQHRATECISLERRIIERPRASPTETLRIIKSTLQAGIRTHEGDIKIISGDRLPMLKAQWPD